MGYVVSKVACLRLDIFFIVSCSMFHLFSKVLVCLAVKYITLVITVIFDLQILMLHVGLM